MGRLTQVADFHSPIAGIFGSIGRKQALRAVSDGVQSVCSQPHSHQEMLHRFGTPQGQLLVVLGASLGVSVAGNDKSILAQGR
jgi:hypothetical protein